MRKNHCRNLTLHVDCNFIFARTMTYSVFRKGYKLNTEIWKLSASKQGSVYLYCPHYVLKSLSVATVFAQAVRLQNGQMWALGWLVVCVRSMYEYRMRVWSWSIVCTYSVWTMKHVYSRSHSHIGASHVNKVMLSTGEHGLVAQTHQTRVRLAFAHNRRKTSQICIPWVFAFILHIRSHSGERIYIYNR